MKKWFAFLPLFLVLSCKHEPTIPSTPVSFSNDVLPIVAGNCQMPGCHGPIDHEEFKLVDYNDFMKDDLIVPLKPHSSKIYEAILSSGENQMPRPPYARLTNEQIKTIYTWILQGAPNN